MTLFEARMVDDRLTWHATATVVGAEYDFELQFVATLASENCYSLRIAVTWTNFAPTDHDYYRATSASWIASWTRGLNAATPPDSPPRSQDHATDPYRELCRVALEAEAHLDSVTAVQQAILEAFQHGARLSASHKEGGPHFHWCENHYFRPR